MLDKTIFDQILVALRRGHVHHVIAALRDLPAAKFYPDACALLARCCGADRERLRVLLADLLADYPSPKVAIPVILRVRGAESRVMALPEIDNIDMPVNVLEAHWLPLRNTKARFTQTDPMLFTNGPQVVLFVLRFREDQQMEVDERWLVRLFSEVPSGTSVRASLGPVLDYAQGIEAGYLLNSMVIRKGTVIPTTTPRFFLQDAGWSETVCQGLAFRETRSAESEVPTRGGL